MHGEATVAFATYVINRGCLSKVSAGGESSCAATWEFA
jgi:hypothetical protein